MSKFRAIEDSKGNVHSKSSLSLVRVNNSVVKPIKTDEKEEPYHYKDLFPDLPCPAVFACGRRRSGKTTKVIYIIQRCVTPMTIVVAVIPTLYKDKSWLAFLRWVKLKGIKFIGKTDLKDGVVERLVERLATEFEANPEKAKDPKRKRFIFIFDDLANLTRSLCITNLVKRGRHFDGLVIASSQRTLDLYPDAASNLDYALLCSSIKRKDLIRFHADANLGIPLDLFIKCYDDATRNTEEKNCLYVNINTDEMRKNFDQKYVFASPPLPPPPPASPSSSSSDEESEYAP